jgi:hypothetical protein
MIVFSLVFLAAASVCTALVGSVGFVLANMLNMSCRILRRYTHSHARTHMHTYTHAHAYIYIYIYFRIPSSVFATTYPASSLQIVGYFRARPLPPGVPHPLAAALPRAPVVAALVVAWFVTSISEVLGRMWY